MKSMNLFRDTKPNGKTYSEDFKKKAVILASKIGITKAAEELGVSTSSIFSWQKALGAFTVTQKIHSEAMQDEEGNLTFEIEGNTYTLNVNSEEERERVKNEVNANSLDKYSWFREKTGEKHWIFYNVKMYEVLSDDKDYLRYREDSGLAPVIPINTTSCYYMFLGYKSLPELDTSSFDTSQITNMSGIFSGCRFIPEIDLSNGNTN